MANVIHVCNLGELQPGDKRAITVDNASILVANVDGKFYAVSNICTHEYAELVNGFLSEDTITCPLHLSRFRLGNGEAVNPPARQPLKTFKVIIQENRVCVEV